MEQLEQRTESRDYLDAFCRFRTAKNWLMWLLALALVFNLAVCLTVRLSSCIERSPSFQADLSIIRLDGSGAAADRAPVRPVAVAHPTTQPTTQPTTRPAVAAVDADSDGGGKCDKAYHAMLVLLPVAKVGGLLCATVLMLVLLLSLKVVLLGRLSGVGYLASAVLWSLVLAVLFVPWDQAFAGFPVPSVLFGGHELIEGAAQVTWGAVNVGWEDHLLYWMRFVGYPVLAMLLLITIQVQYVRGCRPMVAGLRTETEQ